MWNVGLRMSAGLCRNGKHTWELLVSLAATCHQRGRDLVEFLRPQLTLVPSPTRSPRTGAEPALVLADAAQSILGDDFQ
jgi:hypothetical protein